MRAKHIDLLFSSDSTGHFSLTSNRFTTMSEDFTLEKIHFVVSINAAIQDASNKVACAAVNINGEKVFSSIIILDCMFCISVMHLIAPTFQIDRTVDKACYLVRHVLRTLEVKISSCIATFS